MADPDKEFARPLTIHDRELRRYISLFVSRRDDVEEVLQQTAIMLWEKFAEYDPQREFLPWAIRFAYFEILNFRKQIARRRFQHSEETLLALAETRDDLAEELNRRRLALKHCLTKLNAHDRSLLERRYSDSSSVKSLAEETGRTVKALYRRLDRLRQLIYECVDSRIASDATLE